MSEKSLKPYNNITKVEKVHEINDPYNEGTITSMKDISDNLRKFLNEPMSDKEKEVWLKALKDD